LDIFNRTGLRLKREGAEWTISIVYPDSPADAAGLKPGDRIESIDGLRADQIDEDALAARLKGPVGSRLRLVVGAAERRTATLVLRDIL
jgi:carboxyl-terminal processing protease